MAALLNLIERSPALLVGFWFVFGTIIGSFLNVVIYRLPQGMSLVSPPSRCPACGRAIRWYHNVPVLGWLLLGGKCHDCAAPISPRYPLVEFFVGCMFAAVAYVDFIWEHARWLQLADANDPPALTWLLRFAVHMVVLCPLFAAAMIEHDGRRAKKHASPLRPAAMGFLLVLLWFLFGQMAFE